MSRDDNTKITPDGVPEQPREKRQWMLWDSDASTPRRPFGWDEERGTLDFSGSWKEPTDWLTFEEALAAARTKESYGIGFVFREAGDWIALDLDGCLDDNGELKEWVPELDSFEGQTYIEQSPSGTGLHILVEHRQLPPWWSDQHFTDGEHEGVEAYESKFMTVTGNSIGSSARSIGAVNPDGFLWNSFKNIAGETPDLSETSDPDGPPSGGDDEINVTVHDVLSGFTEGERVAHPVHGSGTGSNFHVDDGGETWVCWRGSCPGVGDGNATVGNALHMLGMQENIIDCGDWVRSDLDNDEWEQIFDAARAKGLDVPDKQSQTPRANGGTAAGGGQMMMEPESEAIEPDTDTDTDDPWESIYQEYLSAALDNDGMKTYLRRKARYNATQQFLDQDDWITNEENTQPYIYNNGRYEQRGEKVIERTLSDKIREHYTNSERREVINQMRGETYVEEDEMGGPPFRICAQNGVIDVSGSEPELLPHSPDYNFLAQLGCDYDEDADCPTFKAALDDWISDRKTRMKIQEYAGYCLWHWGLPHHKVLFLVGPTASGKSTFLDTIRAMMGDGTVSNLTPQQLTNDDFDASGIYGKWVNVRNDIPDDMIQNTGMFKEVSAGDPVKIEFKYEDHFYYEPTAKHMFSANQLPDANTDDEAFYRRILLAPFPSTVPEHERDKHLDDKLQSELPGVLNWALEGLQRLQDQGEFTGDLDPTRTQDTWDKWGHAADRFATVCLEESTGENLRKADVYRAFSRFCESENIPSCSQNKFTRRLKEEGIMDGKKYMDGKQRRCYLNVALTSRGEAFLPDDEEDDDDSDHHDGTLDGF